MNSPQNKPEPPSAQADIQRLEELHLQGRYQESLDICLRLMRAHPEITNAWSNAAANCAMLGRWQDAFNYAKTALERGRKVLTVYDALASASGELGHWDDARRYGLQTLHMREQRFGGPPAIPMSDLPAMPPPSAQTRQHNIIAFSLFGQQSKYCEAAVLNAQEQPRIYPHWICRFYVDDSVPAHVLQRLRQGGAQIMQVQGPATQWPGPMWRFLALQDPQAHRILFRDADAVISQREAAAVDEWLASGKQFHVMRDWASHCELIQAGMWGVVAGALPPLEQLMQRFMSAPLESRHYADQYFLRQYVWPYARVNMMQHDAVFGFMDAAPFPDGKMPSKNFHVGCAEGGGSFTAQINLPDGWELVWRLSLIEQDASGQSREAVICAYPGVAQNGAVTGNIPSRYAQRINQGTARVAVFVKSLPPQPA